MPVIFRGKRKLGTSRARARAWTRARVNKGMTSKNHLKEHHFKIRFEKDGVMDNANTRLMDVSVQNVAQRGSMNFQFGDLPNYAELQVLFDQFRINKIVAKYCPQYNGTVANFALAKGAADTTDGYGDIAELYNSKCYAVVDVDDDVLPSTANTLREYAVCKQWIANKPKTIVFTPAIRSLVYKTATTESYQPKFKAWLSTADITVPHYGLKFVVEPNSINSNLNYALATWEYTVYLSCKNTK